jgi:tetratricopeptide (TPR) repeat protein
MEILRHAPNHAAASLLLASARRALGDYVGQIEVLESLVASQPQRADLQFELSRAYGAARVDEAIVAARCALELQPGLADAWRELAKYLSLIGDETAADHAYLRYTQLAPADKHLWEVDKAIAEKRLTIAESLVRAQLTRAPTDTIALRLLAEIQMRQETYRQAEQTLRHCLAIEPAFLRARFDLAQALVWQQQGAAALPELERLLVVSPDDRSYRHLFASALSLVGQQARAITVLAELIKDHPKHLESWMSYGHVLRGAGEHKKSVLAYRAAIELMPDNGEAYWSLANLKTYRFDDADLAAMTVQLQRPDLSVDRRLHFEFAVGKALEDRREHLLSFEHYQRGNTLRRLVDPYDPSEILQGVSRAKEVFTPAFFAARVGWGCADADPIFIVGLPRAGSTLLEQILASHSQVEGTAELPNIAVLAAEVGGGASRIKDSTYPERLLELGRDQVRELGERYLQQTRVNRLSDRPYFIDKNPNNFAHAGFIQLILPNAKIIDARRHPMSCGFSCFKQLFARGQSFSYDLSDIGDYYQKYMALMAHFDRVSPGKVHRVIYERVVADLETEVRRLLAYCSLDFEPACLAFHTNQRVVRTVSSEQVRRPIYSDSLNDWRHVESCLAPLAGALARPYEDYLGDDPA